MFGKAFGLFLLFLFALCTANAQRTVDRAALESLEKACRESGSASYAVQVDGKPVASWNADENPEPIPCHSILKSISSLAVGKLITDGILKSIDTPVYEFYPEWKQGYRKLITLRHLLNHTSGIENQESTMHEWTDAPDLVQVALCTDLVSPAGDYFNYNNKACLLLLGVIGRASGMQPHRYIEQKIFAPLGIGNYKWEFDEAGNTKALSITSDELVKIGQLVLDKGIRNGTRLISEEWINLSLQPGQPHVGNCGLLWWIIPQRTDYIVDDIFLAELKGAGIAPEIIERFEGLKGRYADVNIPAEKLRAAFGEDWEEFLDREFYPHFPARSRREYSPEIIGYKAEGWLGQYIIIYPDKGIVAARMVRTPENNEAVPDEMQDFEKYVYNLVP